MSDKELLYIEDAANHVKHFLKLCDHCAQGVTDPALKSFIQSVKTENEGTYSQLCGLLTRYGG